MSQSQMKQSDWSRLAYPRLCGLLADRPTKLSQAMHNAGFKALGLPFTYCAFDTLETEVALDAMRTLGIRGLSLTIPHKEKAFPLVDHLSEEAKLIGSINTVINDGVALHGFNTDWTGIVEGFGEANVKVQGKRVLLLGAGGAAKAAVYAFLEMGAGDIFVCNRNAQRAKEVADFFKVKTLADADLDTKVLCGFDILVNATPVGSKLGNPNDVPVSLEGAKLPPDAVVFDMVTQETRWLKQAKSQGIKTIPGLRMLVFQAAEQFRLFTEQTAPLAALEQALRNETTLNETTQPS